jgi:regulator of protease activity HflC (stomatin/prohibitin superfamily)
MESPLTFIMALIIMLNISLFTVNEGFIGVSFFGGSLQNYTYYPGFHIKCPFLTTVRQVEIRQQTDTVLDIPCGTSGGILLNFEKIEVVNQLSKSDVLNTVRDFGIDYDRALIFDKVHHEINQWCSKHTLQDVYIDKFDVIDEHLMDTLQKNIDSFNVKLKIISVRVTKPQVPQQITSQFQEMEKQKADYLVAVEEQKVKMKRAETEKKVMLEEATRNKLVEEINNQKNFEREEMESNIRKLRAEYILYETRKLAEGNIHLHTPEFRQLEMYRALGNNTKIYFGDKIPNMFLPTGLN